MTERLTFNVVAASIFVTTDFLNPDQGTKMKHAKPPIRLGMLLTLSSLGANTITTGKLTLPLFHSLRFD